MSGLSRKYSSVAISHATKPEVILFPYEVRDSELCIPYFWVEPELCGSCGGPRRIRYGICRRCAQGVTAENELLKE
ncbi:MAG: hypothetical protein ACN4GW_22060 [Desulforhopalus sp.]